MALFPLPDKGLTHTLGLPFIYTGLNTTQNEFGILLLGKFSNILNSQLIKFKFLNHSFQGLFADSLEIS